MKDKRSTETLTENTSTTLAERGWQGWYYGSYHPGGKEAHEQDGGPPWLGGVGYDDNGHSHGWMMEWYNSSTGYQNISHGGVYGVANGESGHLYQAIIQGVLVCLFTTVGGVMLLVFCLIIIQECKVHKKKISNRVEGLCRGVKF